MNKKYLKHEDVAVPVCDTDRKPDGKTMFKGEIDMEKDGYFVTSFPYKKGYQVTVDNQRIKPELVNTAFLGFPITKGHHDIQIEYTAPGFVLGRAVSLISAVLTALWMFIQHSEVFRYAITGGMTTAVNYLIFFLLTMGKMNYLAANSIAWAGAVLFAYFANRHVVFHSTGSHLREFCSFCGMRAATLAIENVLLYLFIDGIGTAETPAKIAVSVITVILNYAACKYSIFNTKIKEGGNSHE